MKRPRGVPKRAKLYWVWSEKVKCVGRPGHTYEQLAVPVDRPTVIQKVRSQAHA